MKVLVSGGRDYENWQHVHSELDELHKAIPISHLIHGNCRGVDTFAAAWAAKNGVQEVCCPPNWDKHGTYAGPKRNYAMLRLGFNMLLAFPGGRGTADMVRQAEEHNCTIKRCLPTIKGPVLVALRK